MTTKQIIKKAEALYSGMDWMEKEDKSIAIITNSPMREELLALTFKVSEEESLSMDSVYSFVMDSLIIIKDSEATTKDEIEEAGYDIEADSYTSNLTEWLNESNYHIYYLDEAISNGATEGFQLLAMAQSQAKQNVYRIVLEEISK